MPAILAMLAVEYSADRLQSQAWPARTVTAVMLFCCYFNWIKAPASLP